MPRPRGRGSSGFATRARAPRRRMFWETNSIPITTVAGGVETETDLMDGITDREALRRVTIKRLIISLSVNALAINTQIEYSVGVFDVTDAAFLAGAIPSVGAEEVGMYLAADGLTFFSGVNNVSVIKNWDLRSNRTLQGADRTFVFSLTNQGIASLEFSMSFRSLLAYG